MRKMRRSVSILLLVLFMGGSSFAALTGIKTIGVDYPTLAAAIADLNAQGVGSGGVTFNVPANYTETFTLPTAGYITTTTGASGSPVLFQKSGSGSNPVITSAAGAGTMDAIILVAGCDYVTFDGIDLKDNVTNTTPLNQAEWGYAIVKNSAIDGSQNITIKNCAINLNISYTATIGIYSNNHIINDATPLTVTSVTGGNSSNSFDNNTINSYTSISIIGYNDAVVPYAFLDQNNKIGKNGGNTITNVAGGSVAGYGIYTNGQNNLEVANNIITSTMAGTGQPSGIYLTNARNASYDLYNNNVTLNFTGAGATYLNAIYCDMGSTGTSNTMNVYNNVVSGCTFSTVTSGYVYLMYMANLGANVNVHDNNVINNTVGSSSVTANGRIYYLYCNRNTPVTGPMNIYNNTITGNTRIQSAPGGGLTYGLGALGYVTSLNLYNNNFSNNIIASNGGTYSFYLSITGPRNIYDNLVSNITKAEGTFYGIYVTTLTSNAGDGLVYRNKVQNIEGLTAGSNIYGIYSSSSGNPTYYYNNFISDLRTPNSTSQTGVVGFYNSAGTPSGFYNNSVYINTASAGTNFGSTALYSSTSAGLDLRGNILVNTSIPSGTGKTTAIRFSGTSLANFTTVSNYNDLYVPNGPSNYLFFDGTTGDQTLAAYKSRVMPRDAQSVTEMPPFVSITTGSNNLHLQTTVPTQCEAGGTVITLPVPITADIDGNPRYPNAGYPVNASSTPYAPDMGADEIGGLANDLTGPAVTYTPLANTNTSLPRTLDIVVTDGSGVATSGIGLPMLYWKINSGTYQGVQATVVSPNTYSFSFGGGANIGDIVSYYIAAQDQSPAFNVTVLPMGGSGYSANPPACSTPPSGPNSYTILENISGIKHIGVGKDFTTLGEAAVAINTRWISGPLTLVLDDPTYPSETFPISFSTNPGSSPTNILTIRPNTGVSPVLQAVASGLFNFNGIDYLVIDGSNNGTNTKDLSIKNHSTSTGAYAVAFMSNNGDPSTNVTIKNSILSCKPVNSSVVDITVIKTVSPGGGYNNITLDNNTIRAGFYAIRNNGVSGGQNSNWQITNNIIGSELDSLAISDVGISLSYVTNTFIFNNDIMGPASGSLNVGQTGVYIGTNSYSTIVRSNKIHDFVRTSDDGWGVTGIWFASDATTVTEISNNAIYNIKSPGINPGVGQNITYGIFVRSGGNLKILHNSINLTGAVLSNFYEASSACLGFYYQATGGNVEVRNNIFRNGMTTLGGAPNAYGKAYGIMLSTSAGMFSSINNNDYFIDGYNGMIAQFYTNGTGIIIEYPTLADWQAYTGQEANSLYVNPAFTSATYLLPTTTAMPHAGSYISSLPVDIVGITRTNPPDIGAYEFSVNPLIVTTAAAPVSNVTATFNGTANASNTTFDLFFDYGLSTSYGTSVSATPATVTGNSLNTMSYNVSGLTPLTTYHFRARGVTSTGLTVYGNDMTFTTLPDPPAVVTTAATLITGSSATLNGTVNANTSNATPSFEYGLTTSYGTTIAATPGSVSGNTTTPISAAISGLLPNSTYHYRAFATNVTGTGYGLDMTFNTPPILSVVVTNVATNIGSTSAQINGTVTANNASTTVSFQWGLTNAYGNMAVKRFAGSQSIPAAVWRHWQFLAELGWREFAHHLLYHFPHTPRAAAAAGVRRVPLA